MFGNRSSVSATIAGSGGTATSAIPLGTRVPVSLMLPTGSSCFASSTAMVVFPVSMDGTTYSMLRDNSGSVVKVSVSTSNTTGATHLDPSKFRGWSFMKIEARNASAAATVAQSSACAFTVGLERSP